VKIDSQKVINPDLVFNSKNDLEGKILQIGKKIIKRFENRKLMNNRFNSEDKIILAIDGLDISQAKLLLEKCPNIKWVKVGLELFVREGPRVIEILKGLNKKIFLDLKFHDIPNTMRAACFQVSKLGVDIISIHASAGLKALKDSKIASLEGATSVSVKPP